MTDSHAHAQSGRDGDCSLIPTHLFLLQNPGKGNGDLYRKIGPCCNCSKIGLMHTRSKCFLIAAANINSTLNSSTALQVACAFGTKTVIDVFMARNDINVNAVAYAGNVCSSKAAATLVMLG